MGDTDTRMSPGLCLLACLHLSTLTPWGDSQPQLLSLLPFCIERLNNASQSLEAIFFFYTSEPHCRPSSLFLWNIQNDRADQLQKIFQELWNKCMWPTGLFQKDKRPYCCCVPLWRQPIAWQHCDSSSFSDLMLSDVLLIIMNRSRSSMLLVLKRCRKQQLLLWLYSVWFSWWKHSFICFDIYGWSGLGRSFTFCCVKSHSKPRIRWLMDYAW